jgi:hypothetical protein
MLCELSGTEPGLLTIARSNPGSVPGSPIAMRDGAPAARGGLQLS